MVERCCWNSFPPNFVSPVGIISVKDMRNETDKSVEESN